MLLRSDGVAIQNGDLEVITALADAALEGTDGRVVSAVISVCKIQIFADVVILSDAVAAPLPSLNLADHNCDILAIACLSVSSCQSIASELLVCAAVAN